MALARASAEYFFYPGGYLAFIAAAILVETSGGLVQSPITPVLFALVLSAEQFGRFTLNSWIAIGAGVLAAAVLVGYETQIGVAHGFPGRATITIMALSFVVAGSCDAPRRSEELSRLGHMSGADGRRDPSLQSRALALHGGQAIKG